MLLSIGEAASVLGVSVSTLRRWEKEGSLVADTRTQGKHRRYLLSKLLPTNSSSSKRKVVAYSRVSSVGQKEDLSRQTNRLSEYCKERLYNYEVIQDLGSGMNFKKRGLCKVIRMIITGQIEKLILTHRDRLLRFGSELIFELCKFFHTETVCIDADIQSNDNETLAQDVIELMTVFSARLYGKRAQVNRRRRMQVVI